MTVIDVHHHVVPDFYRARLEQAGLLRPIPGVEYPDWSPAASLAAMDRLGIDAAVVSITEPGVHFADAASARVLARQLNEYLAGLVADRPDRFGAFAVLPLPDVHAALDELAYALDTLRLDGVGLLTNYRGAYVGDATFEPLLAELDRRGVPVFLHPARPAGGEQRTFGIPASVYEFPFDTTRTVANLLYSGALDRYPGLRLIVAHAGGAVPYLAGRLADAAVISPVMAERVPDDPIGSLRRLFFDITLSANPYTLPSLHAFADPGRVLLGTDFPFMPSSHAAENWARLRRFHAGSPDLVARIAGGNAHNLFPRLVPVTSGAHMSHDFTDSFANTVFAVVDSRDAEAFGALFAPDGRFVFGNADPILGPAAVTEAVAAFFASIRGLHHRIVNRWEVGADTVAELAVDYHRLDGKTVSVPAVSIWTRDGAGLITNYRIFVDLAPLFAA
jgi:predicted TIM-barrel fold metal-dependent hydrolase